MENIINPCFYVELCPFSSSLVTHSDSNNLVYGNLGKYYCQSPESWRGFADSLKSEEDRKLFLKMLNDCQKYALAINAKEPPFPTVTFDYGSSINTA